MPRWDQMHLIKGLVKHLKNRTLFSALCEKLRYLKMKRRKRWWNTHKDLSKSFIAKIDRSVHMTLQFQSDMAHIIFCNDFEWQERRFLNVFLKPGDLFVDVGANIGLFALSAAKRVGSHGRVFAFEPTPKIFQELCKNVALNKFKNIYCMQKALSDSEGILPLYISVTGLDDYNSFARPITENSFAIEKVFCTTWDIFAAQNNLMGKVTMMKIDVEGWESHVLNGAQATLLRDDAPLLQVEFTDEACLAAGSSCEQLYHRLERLGYHIFQYDHYKRDLIPDPLRKFYPYLNLIATKKPGLTYERIRPSWRLIPFRRRSHA